MYKKKQKNLLFYAALLLVGLLAAFLFSAFSYAVVAKQEVTAGIFLPTVILSSLKDNKEHFALFVSIAFLIVMCVVSLFFSNSDKEHFTSELDMITDVIEIPKAIGQGQHGTARWMKSNEYAKFFGCYSFRMKKGNALSSLNTEYSKTGVPILDSLLEGGITDRMMFQRNRQKQDKEAGT